MALKFVAVHKSLISNEKNQEGLFERFYFAANFIKTFLVCMIFIEKKPRRFCCGKFFNSDNVQ